MISIKAKATNKDNLFGGRNIEVSFGSSSFKTPHRVPTQKDFYAASSLPHKITIQDPVSEYVFAFNNNTFNAFLNGNGSFQRRRAKLTTDQGVHMMRYSPILSTVHVPTERRITQDQLMLFNMFQDHELLDIVSIPPFEYKTIAEFQKVINDFSDSVASRNQIAMPILPLTTDISIFRKEFAALRELKENGLCNIIGFGYANPKKHPQQYLEIYTHRDEDIWYHCYGVPRTPRGRNESPVAHIHEIQNYGIDTYSPEKRDLGVKAVRYMIMKDKSITPNELQISRFDSPTLGILKESDWENRYGHDLHCNCPVCKDRDLVGFKHDFSHELNGDFNSALLRDADRVHEYSSGTNEFNKSAKAIRDDALPDYYKSKEFTRGKIKPPK